MEKCNICYDRGWHYQQPQRAMRTCTCEAATVGTDPCVRFVADLRKGDAWAIFTASKMIAYTTAEPSTLHITNSLKEPYQDNGEPNEPRYHISLSSPSLNAEGFCPNTEEPAIELCYDAAEVLKRYIRHNVLPQDRQERTQIIMLPVAVLKTQLKEVVKSRAQAGETKTYRLHADEPFALIHRHEVEMSERVKILKGACSFLIPIDELPLPPEVARVEVCEVTGEVNVIYQDDEPVAAADEEAEEN